MYETILNIYLIIDNGFVVAFRVKGYEMEGADDTKIEFLKRRAREDFESAYHFDAPKNSRGQFMKYSKFARLEQKGMQYQLFEEIFQSFKIPENPLICVTPVVDGKIISQY